jgi:hypothetical protein
VVLIRLVVLAAVPVTELNRPDITAARPDFPDINPVPSQLIGGRAEGVIPSINRLTGWEQWEVAVPWCAVILEGGEAWVARAIGGLEGNAATGWVANKIIT